MNNKPLNGVNLDTYSEKILLDRFLNNIVYISFEIVSTLTDSIAKLDNIIFPFLGCRQISSNSIWKLLKKLHTLSHEPILLKIMSEMK